MDTGSGGAPGTGVGAGGGVDESTRGTSSSAAARVMGAPGGSGGGLRDICTGVLERLVARGHVDAAAAETVAAFRARLEAHFARLPASYQLYVDVDKEEHVLTHLKVLAEANDNVSRTAFCVQYIRDTSGESEEDDTAGSFISTRSMISQNHTHEITFGAVDKPRLLSQFSALLPDIGLNIRDVHVFRTKDGFSLYIFLVDGWGHEDTICLNKALEASLLRKEAKFYRSSGLVRVRPRVTVRNTAAINKNKLQKLNKEYHQSMMEHFHSILATEISLIVPMMTAVFAVATPLTADEKVKLIFAFIVSGALAFFGLIMSSGTAENKWLPAVRGITLYVTVFALGLFQFAMGLFVQDYDSNDASKLDSANMELSWFGLCNIAAFLMGTAIIVFLWRHLFATAKGAAGERIQEQDRRRNPGNVLQGGSRGAIEQDRGEIPGTN